MRFYGLDCVFVGISVISMYCRGVRGFASGSAKNDLYNFTKGTLSSMKSTSSRGRSTTMLWDDMTNTNTGKRQVYHYEEITSTMDKARELAQSVDAQDIYAVIADRQTNGRGTRGRTWMSGTMNLHLTVSIPMAMINIPLTLTPLRIGTLIRPSIASRIPADIATYLKWPNDVLIEDKKVCGVLIEVENDRMLIGIGCNIGSAPIVDTTGSQAGRPSTCLADHNPSIPDAASSVSPPHHEVAMEIISAIKDWLNTADSASNIIEDFQQYMDFLPQKLRDSYSNSNTRSVSTSVDGEVESLRLEVVPLRINIDGTLQVRYTSTGEEKALVADYLY